MSADIGKYIREAFTAAQQIRNITDAALTDPSLDKNTREDLVWELTRLSSAAADTVAALLHITKEDPI